MIRATTPLQEFTFETNPAEFSRILITYKQDETIVMEKTQADLSFSSYIGEDGIIVYIASFRMTQEEANLFEPEPVRVQVRVLTSDNEALASEITTVRVSDVLDDEVLT